MFRKYVLLSNFTRGVREMSRWFFLFLYKKWTNQNKIKESEIYPEFHCEKREWMTISLRLNAIFFVKNLFKTNAFPCKNHHLQKFSQFIEIFSSYSFFFFLKNLYSTYEHIYSNAFVTSLVSNNKYYKILCII